MHSFSSVFVASIVLSFFAACGGRSRADAGEEWEWRNPLPQGSGLKAMAESGGRLIATGRAGTILTTTDGRNWTPRVSGTRDFLRMVAASGATVVAAGRDGDIVTSSDRGLTWKVRFSSPATEWSLLIHGGGTWVVAGISLAKGFPATALMTSPDGLTWTPRFLPDDTEVIRFYCAVWTGNRFVLGGTSFNSFWPYFTLLTTSPDGKNWTQGTLAPVGVNGMAWTGSRVVAAGVGGISVSPDGDTWSEPLVRDAAFGGVLWSGSQLLAWPEETTQPAYTSPAGSAWTPRKLNADGYFPKAVAGTGHAVLLGLDGGGILYSPDNGLTWKLVDSGVTGNWNALTRFAGRWVAAGGDGVLASSIDGTRWTPGSFGPISPFYAIAWHNGLWVAGTGETVTPQALSTAQNYLLFTSTDGVTWTGRSAGATKEPGLRTVVNIIRAGSRWVAITDRAVLVSLDGIAWEEHNIGVQNRAAAWNGSRLIVIGNTDQSGYMDLSDDGGVTWTHQIPGPYRFTGIAWTGSLFVVVGPGGRIHTSPTGDPGTWVQSNSTAIADLGSVVADGAGAIAIGGTRSRPVILTSPDGATWNARSLPAPGPYHSISKAGALYVITGEDGRVLTSADAVTWTPFETPTTHELYAAAWDGRQLLVAGEGGAILASASPRAIVPWTSIGRRPGPGLKVRLTWPAVSGRVYDIESATSLSLPWLSVPGSPQTATGAEEFLDFTEPGASASPKRFFRLRQRP